MLERMTALTMLCAIGISSPAWAAMPIRAGETIHGELSAASPAAQGWIFACYELDTKPGSQWVLNANSTAIDPTLGVVRGTNCTREQRFDEWDTNGGDGLNAQIKFVAGGGTYLVLVAAIHWAGAPRPAGAFTLSAKELPEVATRRMLPPGPNLTWGPVGTASTTDATPGEQYAPGQMIQDCPSCPAMVVVPPGSFMMGSAPTEEGRSANEGPLHRVTFKRAFAVGKHEVTFDEWNACVDDGGCAYKPGDQGWGQGRRPVIAVDFYDAQRYVGWLSRKTGHKYFLPSESEWEYAARAGTETPWNTGDAIITDDANFLNQFKKTVPVESYPPNAFGLFDTHGNVWEWVQDCLDTGYHGVPTDGSAMIASPCRHIVRGGALDKEPRLLRSAMRHDLANIRAVNVGFRVTRALD